MLILVRVSFVSLPGSIFQQPLGFVKMLFKICFTLNRRPYTLVIDILFSFKICFTAKDICKGVNVGLSGVLISKYIYIFSVIRSVSENHRNKISPLIRSVTSQLAK